MITLKAVVAILKNMNDYEEFQRNSQHLLNFCSICREAVKVDFSIFFTLLPVAVSGKDKTG